LSSPELPIAGLVANRIGVNNEFNASFPFHACLIRINQFGIIRQTNLATIAYSTSKGRVTVGLYIPLPILIRQKIPNHPHRIPTNKRVERLLSVE
jgi:hypothetical protein